MNIDKINFSDYNCFTRNNKGRVKKTRHEISKAFKTIYLPNTNGILTPSPQNQPSIINL